MRIKTDDIEGLPASKATFIAEDGKAMFEVIWNDDGSSVTFRSISSCVVAGIRYSNDLNVRPLSGNAVELRVS